MTSLPYMLRGYLLAVPVALGLAIFASFWLRPKAHKSTKDRV